MDRPRTVDLTKVERVLHHHDHLERFGGRFRFALIRLYWCARELVVSILTDLGDIRDDRTDPQLFTAAAKHYPGLAGYFARLATLRALKDRDQPDPFDPNGPDAISEVMAARNMVTYLLVVANQARARR